MKRFFPVLVLASLLATALAGCAFFQDEPPGRTRDGIDYSHDYEVMQEGGKYVLHIHDVNHEWNHDLERLEGNFTLTATGEQSVVMDGILARFIFNGGDVLAWYLHHNTKPERGSLTIEPFGSRVFNFSIKPDVPRPFDQLGIRFEIRYLDYEENVQQAIFYRNNCLEWNGSQFIYNKSQHPDNDSSNPIKPKCDYERFHWGPELWPPLSYAIDFRFDSPPDIHEPFWKPLCPHCYGEPDPRHHVVYDGVEPYCQGSVSGKFGGGYGKGCGVEENN